MKKQLLNSPKDGNVQNNQIADLNVCKEHILIKKAIDDFSNNMIDIFKGSESSIINSCVDPNIAGNPNRNISSIPTITPIGPVQGKTWTGGYDNPCGGTGYTTWWCSYDEKTGTQHGGGTYWGDVWAGEPSVRTLWFY